MTGHFVSAVGRHCVSNHLSLNKDILFVEVGLGRVTGAGCFLAIETMALHHHLWLSNYSQCDRTATTTAFSKGWVTHVKFSSYLLYVLGVDFAER